MKKLNCLLLFLAAIVALASFGCKKSEAASSQIELSVLNYFSMTNPNAAEEVNLIWDVFDKANPDIKVVREDLFGEPYHYKVESYAAAGQVPDVIQCWPSGRSTSLHTQHLLKDLKPLIDKDGLAQFFNPASLDPAGQGAGYIGMIPRGMTATNAHFINLEVLRDCGLQPAKSYSELKAQVPILRAKGYDTVLMSNEETWVMQSCLFSLVAGRFCGEAWEQKIISGQAKFTDPDFVAALDFIKTLYDDGVITRSTINTPYGDAPGLFATNKAAYYDDGDWQVGAFLTDASTGEALITPSRQSNFLISVFPDIDVPGVKLNRSNSVVLATGWGMSAAIPAGSAKEEAAWRLVKWLSGKESQAFLVETGTFAIPSRTDIDMSSLDLEPLQITAGNLGREYDTATVVIDAAFEGPVYTPLNDGLQAIGMGQQTPQQVAAITQAAFDAWKATQ